VQRMKRAWEAEREILLVVRQFNAVLSANGAVWFKSLVGLRLVVAHPRSGLVIDVEKLVRHGIVGSALFAVITTAPTHIAP